MLALEPTVVDAIWASFGAYFPERDDTAHPLGCHRPRIGDREVQLGVFFVGTVEPVNSRRATIRRPSTED